MPDASIRNNTLQDSKLRQGQANRRCPARSGEIDTRASVSLKDLLDKTLVLYFFPKADTPG